MNVANDMKNVSGIPHSGTRVATDGRIPPPSCFFFFHDTHRFAVGSRIFSDDSHVLSTCSLGFAGESCRFARRSRVFSGGSRLFSDDSRGFLEGSRGFAAGSRGFADDSREFSRRSHGLSRGSRGFSARFTIFATRSPCVAYTMSNAAMGFRGQNPTQPHHQGDSPCQMT